MNDPTLLPPCAEYEFDLVELADGTLAAERARAVRAHLGHCARCRAWQSAYAEVDARLAAALPHPALSSDFDARLKARLAAETRRAPRAERLTEVDSEYRRMLDALRAGARHRALVVGGFAAVAALGATVVLGLLWPEAGAALTSLEPVQRAKVLGGIGCAIALGGLSWSAMMGAVPGLRLRT